MHTDEVYRMFCGSVDDLDAAMESFNQKLKTAGVNRIVEEANRQLAEWRKSGGENEDITDLRKNQRS